MGFLYHEPPDGVASLLVTMRRCLATKEHNHLSRTASNIGMRDRYGQNFQNNQLHRVEWCRTKMSPRDRQAAFARFTFLYRPRSKLPIDEIREPRFLFRLSKEQK